MNNSEEDILFVVNPNSGKKKVLKILDNIKEQFPHSDIFISKSKEEFNKEFQKTIDKYYIYIVVGGDGTINSVAEKLSNFDNKVLAVLPTGSGNGFARELGFTKNVKSLKEDIKRNELIKIDILSLNSDICFNIAGIGFDAFVANDFKESKRRGLLSYIFSIIKSVFKFKPFIIKISSNNFQFEGKIQMLCIANTRQFGNGAIIAPQAIPTDEIYDLVIVKPFPVYYYPIFVLKLMTGKMNDSKFVLFLKIKDKTTIQSNFKLLHIDGEPMSFNKDLKIKLSERKLNVLRSINSNL